MSKIVKTYADRKAGHVVLLTNTGEKVRLNEDSVKITIDKLKIALNLLKQKETLT